MRTFLVTATSFLMLGWMTPRHADAETSAGFDVQGGVGTHGFDASGSLDIKPDPAQKPWEASLSASTLHTTVGTESRANQFTIGLSHEADENSEGHGSLTSWKDTLNDIQYVGPTLGVTYTWLEGGSTRTTNSTSHAYEEGGSATPETEETSDRAERAAITLDTDLFFYTTDVSVSSRTVKVRGRQVVLPGGGGKLHDTQVHPNVSVEKPLWDESVTPYLTAGHYFYSRDPAAIENAAGRPRLAASAGHMNSLVGGFLNNNGEAGVRFILPGDISATTKLGADQSSTNNKWATIQDIALSHRFLTRFKAKTEWTRTIQDGAAADLFSGGLTYYFD
jgi:hypothetical protein